MNQNKKEGKKEGEIVYEGEEKIFWDSSYNF